MAQSSPVTVPARERRTLVVGGALVAGLGLGFAGLAVAAPRALEALYRLAAAPGTDAAVGPTALLSTGIYGGLMVGWGATLALLGRGTAIPRAAGLGLLAWWAVDSAASIATGFPWNALSNTAVLGLFAPLVVGALRPRPAG